MKKLLKLSAGLILAGLILYFVGVFFGGASGWPQWASFPLPSFGARQAVQQVIVQGNAAP